MLTMLYCHRTVQGHIVVATAIAENDRQCVLLVCHTKWWFCMWKLFVFGYTVAHQVVYAHRTWRKVATVKLSSSFHCDTPATAFIAIQKNRREKAKKSTHTWNCKSTSVVLHNIWSFTGMLSTCIYVFLFTLLSLFFIPPSVRCTVWIAFHF